VDLGIFTLETTLLGGVVDENKGRTRVALSSERSIPALETESMNTKSKLCWLLAPFVST